MPDDDPLQLVFSGECIDGHDPRAVREAVASALKLDEERAARLFSGKRVVLRRRADAVAAHRHIARFAMMGALLCAEPSQPARTGRARRWRPLRRSSRRLLRWAGIGVLCILFGVALGLVIGPGLNAQWPDEAPPVAAGPSAVNKLPDPAPVAPAAVDASPATLPPGDASAQPAQGVRDLGQR